MDNLADIIERFILQKIAVEKDNIIILRRNELADELACAPSQISYVLNTRFTTERGFIVESRRGLGGFIRIAQIPLRRIIYHDAAAQIEQNMSFDDLSSIILRLESNNMLTQREAVMLQHFLELLHHRVTPRERAEMLYSLLIKLANYS